MSTRLSAIYFTPELEKLTKDFTGRQWVFDDIDRWLRESDERFFILTGEPGVGKSAIAARLTQIRNDVAAYHFCRAGDVETVRPGRILRSLAAQLGEHLPDYGQALANTIKPIHLRVEVNITVGSMTGSQVTGVYIENLRESDSENELDILIRAPLEELQKMYTERQQTQSDLAIILIDSLDEAVTTTGTTFVKLLTQLSKSTRLPSWIRFVLTSRPERRVLRGFEPLQPYHLQETSNESLSDIRQYVSGRVAQSALQERLHINGVHPQTLTSEITSLSQGNFLYTTLLLNDIEAGYQALDNLAALPKSIDNIYHGFLSRFSEEDWSDCYKSIFGILTVAQEPISERQIACFTKLDPEDVRDSIRVARQFFNIHLNIKDQELYSLFHQSLRDYLLNEERNLDFWIHAKRQHLQIAEYYLEDVWFAVNYQRIDSYGFNHLALHLLKSERKEELYQLLTKSPDWMTAKFNNCIGDAAYVKDLELAIDDFTDSLETSELIQLVELYTARQIVDQRLSFHRDASLQALTWLNRETEALAHARLRSNIRERWNGLLSIYLASKEKGEILASLPDEMLSTAHLIEDSEKRLDSLSTISIILVQVDRIQDALEVASSIERNLQKALTLAQVAMVLVQNGQLQEGERICSSALELALSNPDDWRRRKLGIFIEVSRILIQLGHIEKALEIPNLVEPESEKEQILGFISIVLAHQGIISDALRVADSIKNTSHRLRTLCLMVTALAQKDELQTANSIYKDNLQNIPLVCVDDEFREIYRALAVALASLGLFEQAMQAIAAIEDMGSSSLASNEVIGVLIKAKEFQLALQLADSIKAGGNRTDALSEIAISLAEAEETERALEVAYSIQANEKKQDTLSKISVVFAKKGNIKVADRVYSDSLAVNYPLEFYVTQIAVLAQVIEIFTKANQVHLVLEIIDIIQNNLSVLKDFWLAPIIPTSIIKPLVKMNQVGTAKDICLKFLEQARLIEDDLRRIEVLGAISHAFALVKEIEVSLSIFHTIESTSELFQRTTDNSDYIDSIQAKCIKIQAETLSAITNELVQTGETSQALAINSSVKDQNVLLLGLCSIAKSLHYLNQTEESQKISSEVLRFLSVKNENQVTEIATELIIALLRIGQLQAVEPIINLRPEFKLKGEAALEFVAQLAESGRFKEALETIDTADSLYEKVDGLCELSKRLYQKGENQLAKDISAKALENYQLIGNDMRQITSRTVASIFVQIKDFKKALTILETRNLESFMSTISDWDSAFEDTSEGMSLMIVEAMIRIAAWVSPNWQKIHKILTSPTNS